MTASITAFGPVPLLFASGRGSEIQRPLAIVVIGGLITSTLLTLVLPILFERWARAPGKPKMPDQLLTFPLRDPGYGEDRGSDPHRSRTRRSTSGKRRCAAGISATREPPSR